jgi:hypothetical protein
VTLALRLTFQQTTDQILLGAVGVKIQKTQPAEHACLDTMPDLQALAPGAVKCSTVLGYHSPGDGGGGEFYWDAAAIEDENGGTVIMPSAAPAPGRWKRLAEGNLSVKWFGAIGDGNSHPLSNYYATLQDAEAVYPHIEEFKTGLDTSQDWWKNLELDWVAIQEAITVYMDNPVRYHAIWIPPGVYKLERPLSIGRDSGFWRCHLIGTPNAFPAQAAVFAGTIVQLESLSLPVLIIQGARAVSVTGIHFRNGNSAPYTKFLPKVAESPQQSLNRALFEESDPATWLSSTARDNPYSPQAVIAIDPFMKYLPQGDPANAYPGYEEYYGGTKWKAPASSSGITFRQCGFEGGVVGVAISVSGPAPEGTLEAGLDVIANNENYVFEHCFWVYNKTHLAIGQSQARSIKLDSPRMYGCHIAIDSQQYGIGGNPGQHPIITGAPNIGGCRYFLNVNTMSQVLNVENAYFESTLSLGWIGHGFAGTPNGASFRGCTFDFFTPLAGTPAIPFHLRTFGQVEFQKCTFSHNGTSQIIRVWNAEGRCFLNKCSVINGDRNNNVMIAFHAYDDRLQIEHVHTYNNLVGPLYEAQPKPTVIFRPVNNSEVVQVIQDGTPDKGVIAVSTTSKLAVGDVLAVTPSSPTLIQPECYPDWPAPNHFANAFAYAFHQPIGVIAEITPDTEIKVDNLPEAFPFNKDLRLQAIRWLE